MAGGPAGAVGVDIGGTTVQAVLLGADGTLLGDVSRVTGRGLDAMVASVADAVHALLAPRGLIAADLLGIGIGIPGVVDTVGGIVRHAVNLGLGDHPVALAALVRRATGIEAVQVDNDLTMAATGAAAQHGSGRGDLAFLALGTGIAAGLVLDGRVRRGATGAAGEIGHIPLVGGDRACPCGQTGCLEQYASGAAIEALWPHAGVGVPPPLALFDAADAGDPEALAVRTRVVDAIATAVRLLVLTCDVETVVLGGGVASLGDRLLVAVRESLEQTASRSAFLASYRFADRLRLAPAGIPVGAVGAGYAALRTARTRAQAVLGPRPWDER